jgi:thiopeptide-type bacteriocin biosynthesis protein
LRVLPRFLYRAPLLAVGAPLAGSLAEEALALANVAPEARQRYARRAAFRTTPFGLWAGVGVGSLGDETRAATGAMRASVTVAYERLWRLAREALDPTHARLRVAPSLMRDEMTARWIAYGDDGDAVERTAEIDDVLAGVLDAAAGFVAWSELADAAAVDDDFLFLLVDDGLLVHDGVPPLVGAPPLEWMMQRHPDGRAWADEAPKHAVLVHEGEVTLSRAAVERAAELAPLLFRLQEALAPPMAERALDAGTRAALRATEEIFGAGAYDLDGLALGRYGTPLDVEVDEPPPAQDAGVVREIVGAIVAAVATRTDVTLDRAALEALAPAVATPPTFELILGPTTAADGSGWLLGLHAPAGASWGRFLHAIGAPLVEAMQPLAALPGSVDVDFAPSLRLADLTAHPPLRSHVLALSSWPADDGGALPLASLSLALDGARGEPSLQAGDETIVPAPSWRVRSTTAPRGAARLLTGLSLVRQHAPWALTLGVLADLPHVPRIVLDGFVVAPASWRLPPLADRDALRRWRELWRVPDAVQVGEGDELLLVLLDDAGAIEELRGAARAYEVWPPLDASVDSGGRRLEAIVAVIADETGPPAPLPRVPSPAERAGDSGWHTWKIFGAADRADRVLAGAVAPAIAAAEAAGEIDGWFFLRYVDGPGRRDHLRLRVHATSDAPFAARLEAALGPARAAGDVVTVERAEYQRELGRYGADAIDAVERVFGADSALVLALGTLEEDGDDFGDADATELLVASFDALAAGAGLDDAARHALARRRRDAYGLGRDDALADEYRARQPSLRARLADPPPVFSAHSARVAAALAPLLPERRAALLPALLHLAAVRLIGADAAREAAAIYLWERTRESLARHREG